MQKQFEKGERVRLNPPYEDWQNDRERIIFLRETYNGDGTDKTLVRNVNKNKTVVVMSRRVSKYKKT